MRGLFRKCYNAFSSGTLKSSSGTFTLRTFGSGPLVTVRRSNSLSRVRSGAQLGSLISRRAVVIGRGFQDTCTGRFGYFLFLNAGGPIGVASTGSNLVQQLVSIGPDKRGVPTGGCLSLINGISFRLNKVTYRYGRICRGGGHLCSSCVPAHVVNTSGSFCGFVLSSCCVFGGRGNISLGQT